MKKRFLFTLLLLACAAAPRGVAADTLRVYFIGNSVTDTVRYGELAKLAAAREVKLEWGRTMIPGAPLEWIYTHPNDGFQQEPYGTWSKALHDFAWDAVSLQPFDRQLHGKNDAGKDLGDVALIKEWAEIAARKNTDVQIYLYARWPRVTSGGKGADFDKNDYDPTKPGSGNDLSKVDDFTARWEAKYSGGWDNSNETRDYFDTLLREVRKETPFLKNPPLLVPVGHVMNALHTQMKAGQVPGYTSIYQFYKDGIHLNEAGSYLVGCTYFATLLKQSPVGLPTAPYGKIDPALAETIQKTIWEVVNTRLKAVVPPGPEPASDPAATNSAPTKPVGDVPLNPRVLMYPRSTLIDRLEWTGPAHKLPGTASDMHWHAWGADGALYVVDDDGENFGGPRSFAHLLKVEGRPPEQKAHVVSRFPGIERYSMRRHLYVNGALAVGSRLYVAAYEYDSHDPARAERRFAENVVVAAKGDDFFVLDAISHHGGVASLMYSDDEGVNWANYPVANAPLFLGPRFAGLSFVGFGPGYTGVPEFLDGYVYAISNDESWESGSHVFLARVPKDKVLDRTAWRFYGGRSNTNGAAWIPEEAYARPIITDHGHVGHPTMTYVPGLKRFLLAFGSDAVPKSYAHDPKLAWATWHRRRELQIYEGLTPWGPWALVHYDPAWEGDHIAYLPQLPPCWFSPDGKEGIMMFSGDYRMWGVPEPANHESWYAQMTRPFRLVLK